METIIQASNKNKYEDMAAAAEKVYDILGTLRASIVMEKDVPPTDPANVLDAYYNDNMVLLRRMTKNNDIKLAEVLKESFHEMADTWRIADAAQKNGSPSFDS